MTAAASTWQRLHPHTLEQTALTPDNRGLAYGDGFFSTLGVIEGMIVWQDYHYQRLISHAAALQLALDSQALMATLQACAQQLEQGMMKVVVTRAVQPVRGYGFTPGAAGSASEVWLKSVAMPIDTVNKLLLPDGRTLLMQPAMTVSCLQAQLACLPPPLSGLKSLNRLDSVLASGELQALKVTEPNIGEGLVRDMSGSWVEGTMSNVFYQLSSRSAAGETQTDSEYLLSGQWYTPPLTSSGVAGVMRQVIIDALANTDRPVVMRSLHDEDLPNLTQMFFCNALRGVMPVSALVLLSGQAVEFN
ncbi:aminotransferase class IV [Psychrobacter sp. F1192]|uniref:Aminotransferase class IV n=1 Tax=Psychrobacter coccoides TaxID=2818440 RepID=A0ABS3NM33_9GAMM|nr:aminotransferase class IV [Psychrobacter coccoides]MBO1530455.1 aminotransferase class IV [Psychrobacter coccoides]